VTVPAAEFQTLKGPGPVAGELAYSVVARSQPGFCWKGGPYSWHVVRRSNWGLGGSRRKASRVLSSRQIALPHCSFRIEAVAFVFRPLIGLGGRSTPPTPWFGDHRPSKGPQCQTRARPPGVPSHAYQYSYHTRGVSRVQVESVLIGITFSRVVRETNTTS